MIYNLIPNKEGNIPKAARQAIQKELLSFAGKRIRIIIEKYVKKRSNEQLAYWFAGIVKPFGIKFGYDKDQSHTMLKLLCGWYDIIIDPDGNEQKVVRSINTNEKGEKTTTTEMMGLVELAIQFCAEHDLVIQDPDQYYQEVERQF